MTVVFPAPLGPIERDSLSRLQAEVEPLEHRCLLGVVAGGHTVEGDVDRPPGRRRGPNRVHDRRASIGELEHALAGGERRRELTRCSRQRRDRVEGREREQRERRDEDAVERARVVRTDREREHHDGGQAGDEDECPFDDARGQRVAPREADELTVGRPHTADRLILAPVGDELGSTAQQLDELRAQRAPRRGLTPASSTAETRGGDGQRNSSEREPHCERDRRPRQDERGREHARERDDQADDGRRETAEEETLEGVDVGDQAADEIAAPKRVELARSERLDAAVNRRADPPQ